jgi:nickel-dependent lactate racemase
MSIPMSYGRISVAFEVAPGQQIAIQGPPAPLPNPGAAVQAALETPFHFPALRRALTPDDHVTVVLDERLPGLVDLLTPILEQVTAAGVSTEGITLLCPPASRQIWVDDLPDVYEEVHLEVHDPQERKRLSYLATMRQGKRLYLNRTLVDADQVVVLTGRRYDSLLGYGGAEGALYPMMSDQETRAEASKHARLALPTAGRREVHEEAVETAWLLGAPFFVQIIEGPGDTVADVVAGTTEASAEGQRRLDACWRRSITQAADLVIASLSGDPARHTMTDLASAFACASRVVKPNGRIVLLTQACPDLGAVIDRFRDAGDPQVLLGHPHRQESLDLIPTLQWASAASQAHLYLLSDLAEDLVEDMFATPLQEASQVQRLLDEGGACLFMQDAHKMLAVLAEGGEEA